MIDLQNYDRQTYLYIYLFFGDLQDYIQNYYEQVLTTFHFLSHLKINQFVCLSICMSICQCMQQSFCPSSVRQLLFSRYIKCINDIIIVFRCNIFHVWWYIINYYKFISYNFMLYYFPIIIGDEVLQFIDHWLIPGKNELTS